MRMQENLALRPDRDADSDPRESADVIDLATRRVLPSVSQQRRGREGIGLAAGVAFVAMLGAVTLWTMNSVRTGEGDASPSPQGAQVPAPVTPPAPQPMPNAVPAPAPAAPPPQPVLSQAPVPAPAANSYANPTIVFDASAMPEAAAPALASPAGGNPAGGTPNDEFASRIGGVGGGKATAAANIDPKTTVAQGTLIPAVLETAIDTDVPGYARAVVSADVRSFDGSRVLVPRSSRLIGQYKSGLQGGQKRAYVVWTRLIRPDGVSVNIASPATGFSGETGLAGKVNSHFFERFGSAMLLSVISGLSTIAGGVPSVVVGGGGQSAAAAAIGQTGQIGPTVRVRQGEPVRVFTARDLDFSKVATE
ncbi:TrbI/VirB10 family protein [Sphingobium subterraneum]|uniref:Type IV secretion system protein VirB10 n=1 Tax=Sphingobium subterraneum TaxID=627688 RepID=A0A841J234_9SPHN|nr:TrbI/VirB10 family protein [Sphingobium subterraneum]MBB6124887.1 type IV secretion system protein VirB10 [Sphingobium subterraneum]